MKNLLKFLVTLTLLLTTAALVTATDKVEGPDSCKYCNMNRTRFSYSRMLITYQDGSSTGTCSLHCAAVELASNIDKMPTSIKVGDFTTQKLIDAETAHWVIGGDKMGVIPRQVGLCQQADARLYKDAQAAGQL